MKHCVMILLAVSLAACASGAPKKAMEDDPSKGIICTSAIPTGSTIRERKCTTPEEREAQRRQAEHQIVIQPAPGNAR